MIAIIIGENANNSYVTVQLRFNKVVKVKRIHIDDLYRQAFAGNVILYYSMEDYLECQ